MLCIHVMYISYICHMLYKYYTHICYQMLLQIGIRDGLADLKKLE